jgi:hypothetical protein
MTRPSFAALAATLAVVISLSGCGDGRSITCAVVDISGSTALARGEYFPRLRTDIEAVAAKGGTALVVAANGNPLVESRIDEQSFDGLQGTERANERDAKVGAFMETVQLDAQAAVTSPTPGSGIVGALNLFDGKGCGLIIVYSDGIERADISPDTEDILTASGRARIVDRLASEGRVPDLRGARISFPFGGYVPQGTKLSQERVAALHPLWQAYARRANAKLVGWRD